jgi:hypothetical protein
MVTEPPESEYKSGVSDPLGWGSGSGKEQMRMANKRETETEIRIGQTIWRVAPEVTPQERPQERPIATWYPDWDNLPDTGCADALCTPSRTTRTDRNYAGMRKAAEQKADRLGVVIVGVAVVIAIILLVVKL